MTTPRDHPGYPSRAATAGRCQPIQVGWTSSVTPPHTSSSASDRSHPALTGTQARLAGPPSHDAENAVQARALGHGNSFPPTLLAYYVVPLKLAPSCWMSWEPGKEQVPTADSPGTARRPLRARTSCAYNKAVKKILGEPSAASL